LRESGNAGRQLLRRIMAFGVLISAATLPTTIATLAQEGGQSWTYTGSLNTARDRHSATLLPNGKVLVVGGFSDAQIHTAELYDPQTGTWSVTGSPNVPTTSVSHGDTARERQGAPRWGVNSPDDLTSTAELYDPATGEWSFTGSLSAPLASHTATLLANGKVLFAGGGFLTHDGIGISFNPTKTAQLYDPATGKWSLTGNLSETRIGHNATLLQDGKVLVAGGCLDGDCMFYLDSVELFDPNTETWSLTGTINTPRDGHTLTTLPNGNVLLSGGQGRPFPFTLNTVEIYNPVSGRWSASSFLKRRWAATVTLLPSGEVLVAGGSFSYDSANPGHTEVFNSGELYDPATGGLKTSASLKTARHYHSATLLNNGTALIVGGSDDHNALRSAELYSTTGSEKVITVSAASYHLTGLSSNAIATSFGTGLATASITANTLPLPTEIAGTTVKVKDSTGTERLAPLLYVSPTQVNYLIPAGTTLGAATATITSGGGSVSSGIVLIKPVAPSLFAANGNGQGVGAAVALRVKADGSRSYEEVVQFDAVWNSFIARPLDLGPESDQVYLVLFGTGIRSRSSLSAVIATIGGAYATVSFAGMQQDFEGLDQVNVLLPRSLMRRGEVDVLLTVEAQMANPVRIHIK
jgi:uncharacterized protein (TIGR03437 family)